MPVSWTELAEGDLVSGTAFTTTLAGIVNEINALDEPAVERNSLHAAHLPSVAFSRGTAFIDSSAAHTYSFAVNPYPGWNTVAGWTLLSNGAGQSLSVTGLAIGTGLVKTIGALVYANVHVEDIDTPGVGNIRNRFAVCCIQVVDSGGTRYHISRTERYIPAEVPTGIAPLVPIYRDMAIRTLIQASDIAGGTGVIAQVDMMVSVLAPAGQSAIVTMREGNLTVVGLQGGPL